MSILQLPVELLHMIFKDLSLKDKVNIYDSCPQLARVLVCEKSNKCFVLSLSTLATCNTLKHPYIKDMSSVIEELDMSGVPDLTKSNFIPCLKWLKNLKTLNIAYTNIIIPDLIDLNLRIKNITINFYLCKDQSVHISHNTLISCQNFFKDFDSIHFVGAYENLIHSRLPLYILSKTRNNISLKFTALNYFNGVIYKTVNFTEDFTFQFLTINIPHWRDNTSYYYDCFSLDTKSNFNLLNMDNLNYVIFLKAEEEQVLASEEFKDFFKDNFNVETKSVSVLWDEKFCSNSLFYFWNKDLVTFDEAFFNELKLKIKDFFPSSLQCDTGLFNNNEHTSWYFIEPSSTGPEENYAPPPLRRQRVAPEPIVLNYDHIFYKNATIKLKLYNATLLRVFTFPQHCNYLQKLTVLSIDSVRLTNEFFKILFESCTNLVTLNIESTSLYPCTLLISQSVHLTKTLKNFRLVEHRIGFKSLLKALSRCKTLENINIVEVSCINGCNLQEEDLSSLITHCSNLYYIYIHVFISDSMKMKILRSIKKLIQMYDKNYLNVVINVNKNKTTYSYDPYISVFPIFPIKD